MSECCLTWSPFPQVAYRFTLQLSRLYQMNCFRNICWFSLMLSSKFLAQLSQKLHSITSSWLLKDISPWLGSSKTEGRRICFCHFLSVVTGREHRVSCIIGRCCTTNYKASWESNFEPSFINCNCRLLRQ